MHGKKIMLDYHEFLTHKFIIFYNILNIRRATPIQQKWINTIQILYLAMNFESMSCSMPHAIATDQVHRHSAQIY